MHKIDTPEGTFTVAWHPTQLALAFAGDEKSRDNDRFVERIPPCLQFNSFELLVCFKCSLCLHGAWIVSHAAKVLNSFDVFGACACRGAGTIRIFGNMPDRPRR